MTKKLLTTEEDAQRRVRNEHDACIREERARALRLYYEELGPGVMDEEDIDNIVSKHAQDPVDCQCPCCSCNNDLEHNPLRRTKMEHVARSTGDTIATPAQGLGGTVDNWKHRSANLLCQTCIWYLTKKAPVGRCRRRAPELGGFPVVFETDWCGDHKLDESKV